MLRQAGAPKHRAVRLAAALALLLSAQAVPAAAHHRNADKTAAAGAILIPSLSHGQMAVIASNKAAILDLADRQLHSDSTVKRLLNFVNIQFSVCLWGLVPGSLTDEGSPFNECTHAYLAATKALLMQMQISTSDAKPVSALAEKIELEMLSDSASLVLCRYSGEPFNTAEIVYPNWKAALFHPSSLLAFLSLALMAASFMPIIAWLRRKAYPAA
jgi:hypothetical protein